MYGKLFNKNTPNDYDLLLGFLQLYDLLLNVSQTSNDTIMHELQKQNKEYLQKIIQQNNQIIELLNKMKEG